MKSSLPANFRVKSWTRKSKRYGNKAPGNKNGDEPKLDNFIDTSGSISIQEANNFLDIVDEFLRVGAKKCTLNMFHTSNYYREDYKRGRRIKREDIQSGGTCLEDSFRVIAKNRPDLAIVLTDGHYSHVDTKKLVGPNGRFPNTVFIISKDGTTNHPFKDEPWAKTVQIPR
jgi:predicted metal-dependent peptidase